MVDQLCVDRLNTECEGKGVSSGEKIVQVTSSWTDGQRAEVR